MTPENLKKIIASRESQLVEFKSSFKEQNEAIESLCAFANAQGGTVLFGVDDKMKIVGVAIGENTIKKFANELTNNTDPGLIAHIEEIPLEEHIVVNVSVDKHSPGQLFYAFNRPYIRIGDTNQVMSPDQQRARLLEWVPQIAKKGDTFPGFPIYSESTTSLGRHLILPESEIYTQSPFISIRWDSSIQVRLTNTELLLVDSSGITISTKSILKDMVTGDNLVYVYAARELPFGRYKVVATGVDALGHKFVAEGKFIITLLKPFNVALSPDWNLISVPRDPKEQAINKAISPNHPINQIITYDPKDPALFLFASRTGTKPFSGTLSKITSNRAYWVFTTSSVPLGVNLTTFVTQTMIPPTLSVVKGWNLLPILSLTNPVPATIKADEYFATISWTKAFWWDNISRKYVPLLPGHLGTVSVGRGYWVYITDEGMLIP